MAKMLESKYSKKEVSTETERDELIGAKIVLKAITRPLWQIAENAGEPGEVVVKEVYKLSGNKGYNAATGIYEDMIEAGIVDPTKVTRSTLQNAASASAMLLTTEAVVAEKPEKKETPHMPPGGMDM